MIFKNSKDQKGAEIPAGTLFFFCKVTLKDYIKKNKPHNTI